MNKMKIVKTIVALSVVVALGQRGFSAPPLAEKVPDQTLIYVGWAGRSLTFDGSMFGQLLAEQGVKDLFGAIKTAATTGLKMTDEPEAPEIFESLWAMGAIAWQHPVTASLFDISMPPPPAGGGPAAGATEPLPVGAILVDLQKDRAAFTPHFQKLLATIGKKVELSQATAGNLSYHSFATPAGPCSMGFVGDVFFVAIGEGAPAKVAAVADGKAKALSGAPKFTAAMKQVSGEHVQMAYYVDVPRLLTIAEKITPMPPTTAPAGENQFRKIIKALGIDGVTAVAGASTIVDRGFHEKCRIFSPGPHKGLLTLLAGKPLGAAALEGVPADADFVATINLDPAKLLDEIKRIATAIDPNAGKQIERMLAKTVDKFGLDIEKDLLAYMGDQWTIVSAPSLGGTLTGTVIVVGLKDAEKFSASLAKLEAQLAEMMGGGPAATMPTRPRGRRRRGPKATIHKYKSGEIEVHYVKMSPDMPLPVAPAWAVHKGRFYLAAFPQVVVAAAGGTAEKPLAQSATFAALRKRLSPNASALMYTNTPSLVRRFYGAVLAGGTAATNALGRFAPTFRPEMLPPLPKVEKYIWPDIAAISSDAGGITIESYGSLPGGGLSYTISPAQQGLMVSALLPVLGRARTQARKAKSGAHLSGIGKGCIIYACDNNDQLPPDLVKLVESGVAMPGMLMSPNSGREVRLDSKGKPIGPFDYVYLGAQMPSGAPGQMILAYERPEINRNKGTNVLYVSGSVRWVSMAEFRRELARTQEYLRKQSKGAGPNGVK